MCFLSCVTHKLAVLLLIFDAGNANNPLNIMVVCYIIMLYLFVFAFTSDMPIITVTASHSGLTPQTFYEKVKILLN